MKPKRACKKCRIIVDSGNCPICGGNQFSESCKGRIIVLSEESEIAKKIKLKGKGEFAVKVG